MVPVGSRVVDLVGPIEYYPVQVLEILSLVWNISKGSQNVVLCGLVVWK
jgi:hypothetical protein